MISTVNSEFSLQVKASGSTKYSSNTDAFGSIAVLPRHDLIPLQDDLPSDGIIFARIRNQPDSLVIFRTPEERLRNPERLNLDRRQLESCPLLEQEHRLRLLNYQNNLIKQITNLENLPNLIFLDLYNNQLTSLEGPLSCVKGLRVLMAGKNKIDRIANLPTLRRLDVLDLHSNDIKLIEGLDGLTDLRVLNLAGNRISIVNNLQSLSSLTELNLRRNRIRSVHGLDQLPALQRIFLSHNLIQSFSDVSCVFDVQLLIELSLDGNPIADGDPGTYRQHIIASITSLKHLDLRRIANEERPLVSSTKGGSSSGSAIEDERQILCTTELAESADPILAASSSSEKGFYY
jgi:leucine-rich repeat-containing protein 49